MTDAFQQAHADEQDASMDTILASIRRIIMEDEAGAAPPGHLPAEDADDDLLVLQPSMIVDPVGVKDAAMAEPQHGARSAADLAAALFDEPLVAAAPAPLPAPTPAPVSAQRAAEPALPQTSSLSHPGSVSPQPVTDAALLAPAASLAASQSLARLQDAMRPAPPALHLLRSGGPTIEDMVREELRLQLKEWLDGNLPSLVERLVAQEIDRLVGRA